MKNVLFIFSLIGFLSIPASAQRSAGGKIDPSKGVREAFERFIDGIKTVDADKVMSSYEKSDKLLVFNNNGTATQGWDNVSLNTHATYSKLSNVAIEVTGLRVEMLGASGAYVSCKWKQTQENDGKLEDASGRMTLIYKLVGKEWKITHRHTSPDNPAASRPVFPSERQ